MQVGFDGMVYCTKTVLPSMLQQKFGRIVYLSSVSSTLHLFPSYAAYAALKAATDAWANMLQIELRDSGIQISCIRPGIVKGTDFFKRSVDRANLPRLFDLMPATTPEAVARAIVRSIVKSNRTIIVPMSYRIAQWLYYLMPGISRWLCRGGTSRRRDFQTRDERHHP